MKPTIRDVARYADVSVATVSRYLNNSSLIAEASVEKVKRAIEDMKYKPSIIARGLLHGKTKTIALAIDDNNVETYGDNFFLHIQYGLRHELTANGYYLMTAHIGTGEEALSSLETIIKEDRIDGLVLLSELAPPPVLDLLDEFLFPFVVTGRVEKQDVSWVDVDNFAAGYVATQRLLATGADDIGFITNSFGKVFASERFAGYKKAMSEAGLHIKSENIIEGLFTSIDAWNTFSSNINTLMKAYVISDSTIAFYLSRFLEKMNIKVPEQVQFIAFDNNTLAEAFDMTVVDIDVTELGKVAGKALMKQLHTDEKCVMHSLLSVKIVERRSAKPRM